MSEFVDHVLELMAPWAAVRARRMFGGYGLYRDTTMFALVADDTLYLKADAASRALSPRAARPLSTKEADTSSR